MNRMGFGGSPSSDYTVQAPERVPLEFGIAGVGSRGGAAIVDTAIQSLALVVLFFGLAGASAASRSFVANLGGAARAGLVIGLFLLGLFVITSGYYMLFEILWSGQTPGKRMVGLRVIRESGYPIRPVDAVIRNVVRIVDWLPIGYGIGVLTMLLNGRSKRLGDFAAGTIVVREGAHGAISAFPADSASVESRQYVLSSADATLVRDFLVRRDSLHPSARADLARRLADAIARRYRLPTAESDPERFLETLTL